jgi:hypothetical protein
MFHQVDETNFLGRYAKILSHTIEVVIRIAEPRVFACLVVDAHYLVSFKPFLSYEF